MKTATAKELRSRAAAILGSVRNIARIGLYPFVQRVIIKQAGNDNDETASICERLRKN